MALIVCPRCGERGFTWFSGESSAHSTDWRCFSCCYAATEDEKLEARCPACDAPGSVVLRDRERTYRYCHLCGGKTAVDVEQR